MINSLRNPTKAPITSYVYLNLSCHVSKFNAKDTAITFSLELATQAREKGFNFHRMSFPFEKWLALGGKCNYAWLHCSFVYLSIIGIQYMGPVCTGSKFIYFLPNQSVCV